MGGYDSTTRCLTIVRGDSYSSAAGQTLSIDKPTGESWPTLDGTWTVTFSARLRDTTAATGTTTLTVTAVVVDSDTVRIDLTAANTTGLDLGPTAGTGSKGAHAWNWELEASKSTDRNTLIRGMMTVQKDLKTT